MKKLSLMEKKHIINYIRKYAADELSVKEQVLLQINKTVSFLIKRINEKYKDKIPPVIKTIQNNLSESLKFLTVGNFVKDSKTGRLNFKYYQSLIDNISTNISNLKNQEGISDFDPEENIQYFIMWIDSALIYLRSAKQQLNVVEDYLPIDKTIQTNLYNLYKMPIGPKTIDGKLGPKTMELVNKARKNLLTPPYFTLERLNERIVTALQYPSVKDYVAQGWGEEYLTRAGLA